MQTRYLKASEVASVLRVPVARVYELARQGQIPSVKLGERQLRFIEEDLLEWARKGGTLRKDAGGPKAA